MQRSETAWMIYLVGYQSVSPFEPAVDRFPAAETAVQFYNAAQKRTYASGARHMGRLMSSFQYQRSNCRLKTTPSWVQSDRTESLSQIASHSRM